MNQLKLPDTNFLSTYNTAHQFVTNATGSHKKLWEVIDACQNHISGEKPIPPNELKKRGLAWSSNFNFGKARAKIEKGTAESIAKVSSALAMGYVGFRNYKKEDDSDPVLDFMKSEEMRGIVAANIGASFSAVLEQETRLSGFLNEVEYPSYAFGFCALGYSPHDWMPEPIHPRNIAFKPNTRPENIPAWVTMKKMEATELYKRWVMARNEATTQIEEGKQVISSSGWNLKGLEEILKLAFKGRIDKGGATNVIPETWEDVIPTFTENPSYVISNTDTVSVAKIYYKELNGSLSEIYIPWNNPWQTEDEKELVRNDNHVDYILFTKNYSKYRQDNYIGIIRDSGFSETGFIQDYRGVAKFAVEDSIRYNRTRNSALNKLTFVGSPMFEANGTQGVEKFKVTVSQGFTILSPGYSPIEKQPSFNIADHLNILRFEEGEYVRDTQQYDASIHGRLSSRPNKDEVQSIGAEVAFTNNSKNHVKLRDYAANFFVIIKRITNSRCLPEDPGYEGQKRFFEEMKNNINFLKTNEDVKKLMGVVTSFVLEPVITDLDSLQLALRMAETPFARNRLKRMVMIAQGFPIKEVNLAVPLISDKFNNLQDLRMAMIENDMLFTTNEIVVTGTDDHIVHLDTHFDKATRTIQGFQDGRLSALNAYKYLENMLGHTLTHIQMLGEDPVFESKAKEYFQTQSLLDRQKRDIMGVAKEQADQQAREAENMQVDPKTQAQIEDDRYKTEADIGRKDFIAAKRTEQREEQINQTHELKMREMDLKHQREQLAITQNRNEQQ